MQSAMPLIFALLYAALLFGFAAWAESKQSSSAKSAIRLPAYALAIGVYCTSWTYYGAVGSAVADGWSYLPIYLGPILVFVFGRRFLVKLVDAVKADGANSISEFIGGRFGSSRGVAALVTLLALLGSIPYLALQLQSLSTTYALLSGVENSALVLSVSAFLLALWAMLYGTRRYEVSARNDAVLFAVGFESLLKLAGLLVAGGFALNWFFDAPQDVQRRSMETLTGRFDTRAIDLEFFIITLLSMAAIICLPRQFFIMVIEGQSGRDVEKARWPFIAYMVATLVVVLPLSLAGIALLPETTRPDLFVLELPLSQGWKGLAIFVFLGGFSAATAMVLVETIALSTMVSNDLIAPALLRQSNLDQTNNFNATMLHLRRGLIALIMLAALVWALAMPGNQQLASIGLVAFAAMAQFGLILILSVYGGNRDAFAAKLSLSVGLVVWFYTLALPQLLGPERLTQLSGSIFNPHNLGNIGDLSPISHGTVWSLGLNALVFVLATARRVRAGAIPALLRAPNMLDDQGARIGDLKQLVARFVGSEVAQESFASISEAATVSRNAVRKAERLIAGVVGLPTARALIGSRLFGAQLTPEEVSRLLDDTGQSLRFSKDLLASTLEHIDPGVSVVDRDLNVVAWNTRYLEMFNYPEGMVYVGAPVADLIRYNALRGECGPGEVDGHVGRRLGHMRRGQAHSFERVRPDGRVLKTVGGPMPSGGYVMCFTDVTSEAQAIAALRRAQAELETRVEERTLDLRAANDALAKADAEKTRFLAAASHDLLQPIHAARLFSSTLARDLGHDERGLLRKLDLSIESADTLLRALLDISKLDAGGVVPVPETINLRTFLESLNETMRPMAAERGLELRLRSSDYFVKTDAAILRSIVQNFLSNAIRYTTLGGILVGVRRHAGGLRIDVYDTGSGIDGQHHKQIFREFERLPNTTGGGIGLGLAIVERSARLIDASISLNSRLGRGSRFSVALPEAKAETFVAAPQVRQTKAASQKQATLPSVLIVEDDPTNIEALTAFLTSHNYHCEVAQTADQGISARGPFDVALIDFNLGEGMDGLDVVETLKARDPKTRFALITAAPKPLFNARAQALDVEVFRKPLDPARFMAWLEEQQEEV